MSWRDAPLYVEAHDIARDIIDRVGRMSQPHSDALRPALAQAALDLLVSVSLALTFPAPRARHLERADEAIVRLRVLIRLSRDLGFISAGGTRHVEARLLAAGRMLGGWRKRVPRASERTKRGSEPPTARDA